MNVYKSSIPECCGSCYVCTLKYLRDKAILSRYCSLMESEMGVAPEDALREYMVWYHEWHLEMENA